MFARFRSPPFVSSPFFGRCCGLLFVVVLAGQAEPALAQKAQFDRKKPHVNVSGDSVDPPPIVELVVAEVGDDGALDFVPVGEVVILAERSADSLLDVAIVTPHGVEFARLNCDAFAAPVEDSGETFWSGATLAEFDELSSESPTPQYGYVRIKKLNSGG